MAMDTTAAEIRSDTIATAIALGYPTNPRLPLLDGVASVRPQPEVVARTLCLLAASACAFGFSKEAAQHWIAAEDLGDSLTTAEGDLLSGRRRATVDDRYQVEAIWALLWALSIASNLDFGHPCPDTSVRLLPDLRSAEPAEAFRATCRLRDPSELIRVLDLAYMLHWSVVEERLQRREHSRPLSAHAVRHRRHALEWLLCTDDWDQVELDT